MNSSFFSRQKHSLMALALVVLFLITRAYIWLNPPPEFTEIIYSYMPYAHLWASGVKPYLEQWYEYPPLTIPLFYLPHIIDRETHGTLLHINYLYAYRLLLFLVDTALFAVVWRSLVRFKVAARLRWTALLYFCLITAKANHFLYDTMDWTFAAALTLSATPTLWGSMKSPVILTRQQFVGSFLAGLQTWLGYWLAVGLKLMNGPLGLPLALLQRQQWRSKWFALLVAGGLVWGIPVLLYRSSLSVMLVFHQIRGLQVDSFTAIIVRVVNSFVHSDTIIEVYKNYETSGPLTTQALGILNVVFPLALVAFTGWTAWQAWKLAPRHKEHAAFRVSLTLGYILLLMIVSKVLSRPFMLWHIPLLAIMPFDNWRQQLRFFVPSVLAVAVTLSAIPDVPVGPLNTATLVGVLRSVAYLWLFVQWFLWHRRHFSLEK